MLESKIKAIIRQGEGARIEDGDFNITENSYEPHGHGMIDPSHFTPYPKNPSIARLFREIGRADELGSGVRNLFKYCKVYCGHDPQLIEQDIFKFILPLTGEATPQAEGNKISRVLAFCIEPKTRGEIQRFLGLKDREHLRLEILKPLIEKGALLLTIPDKPKSPKQKYFSAKQEEIKK